MATYYYSFENGQGVGNQLWSYISLKLIFKKRNENIFFTGYDFFKLKVLYPDVDFQSEFVVDFSADHIVYEKIDYAKNSDFPVKENLFKSLFELNQSDLKVELKGLFQKESYLDGLNELSFLHYKYSSLPLIDKEICIIHVRGGDYLSIPASLTLNYYNYAIKLMREKFKVINFKILTNDFKYARKLFPDFEIIGSGKTSQTIEETNASHHIGGSIKEDFEILYQARNVILSNSTFAYWPVKISTHKKNIIAPMYWFAYNLSNGWWSPSDSIVESWIYINHAKNFFCEGKKIQKEKYKTLSSIKYNFYSIKFRIRGKLLKILNWTSLN